MLAAAFGLAACNPATTSELPGSSAAKVSRLQELATRDCQCRLAGNAESRHGKEYARLTAKLRREASATASFPVSYESECFPALGANACVMTGGYLPPESSNFVCTEAQGIELEKLWDAAYARTASETMADEMVLQRLGKMREEAKTAVRDKDCA